MITDCPFCDTPLDVCVCEDRKRRSNMIDTSVFIEAYDESEHAEECKLLIDGAAKKVYLGNITTIILGEITKKLLKLKKESDTRSHYRYESMYKKIMEDLVNFKIHYICKETLEQCENLSSRHSTDSHDNLNFACAMRNKCKWFIMKDGSFSQSSRRHGECQVKQISNRNDSDMRQLLDEIRRR